MAIALRKGLTDFVPILKSIEVVRLTADNETCAAALQIDTFFGVIPFLEFFCSAHEKIASIRVRFLKASAVVRHKIVAQEISIRKLSEIRND